jgi:uroporphyrinogen-III synthase
MRLLVTRPEPDAGREAETLMARGHQPVLAPLLTIAFDRAAPLDLDGAQALIATSRNALRALAAHPALGEALKLPLLAVGDATAGEAQALGFADVTIGPGTGAKLAKLIVREFEPGRGDLVHLSGDAIAFDLKSALEAESFTVRRIVLYRAVPEAAFPDEAVRLFEAGELDGVILMSPRTAKTFAQLVAGHGLVTQANSLVCYCLSEAVAEAVRPLGGKIRVASSPREEDVLALVDSEAASS